MTKGHYILMGICIGMFLSWGEITFLKGQAPVAWFTASANDVTCQFQKLSNNGAAAPKIGFYCSSPRSVLSGSWTSVSSSFIESANIGIGRIFPITDGNGSSIHCLMGMNTTQTSQVEGTLGNVPAGGATAQCDNVAGFSQSWP